MQALCMHNAKCIMEQVHRACFNTVNPMDFQLFLSWITRIAQWDGTIRENPWISHPMAKWDGMGPRLKNFEGLSHRNFCIKSIGYFRWTLSIFLSEIVEIISYFGFSCIKWSFSSKFLRKSPWKQNYHANMGYSWDFLSILDDFLKLWDGMGYPRLSENTPKPIPYGMGWDCYEIVVPLPNPE